MTDRSLRVDAQRNRDKLIEVALQAFSLDGADVSLDSIAKTAGVGIGTLYRHFPTREALVEAIYRNELGRLCESATFLLERSEPLPALREWMLGFNDYLATKRGMADALQAVIDSGQDLFAQSRARLVGAADLLLAACITSGHIRKEIDTMDFLIALSGLSKITLDRSQQVRLLNLLLDGLRYQE